MEIVWLPEDEPLAAQLRSLSAAAAERLQLARLLGGLTLCLDDIAADERIWLTAAPPARRSEEGERPRLTLYFHPDQFLQDRAPMGPSSPSLRPWELARPPAAGGGAPAVFSLRKAERILYHQFLLVRDLCDGTVDPRRVPRALAEAFQEAWAVTLDGRLRRQMLPGFSLAERRRRFFRVFSAGGVLLPQHWQIFHALWESEDVEQEGLLDLLKRLPAVRLTGRFGA